MAEANSDAKPVFVDVTGTSDQFHEYTENAKKIEASTDEKEEEQKEQVVAETSEKQESKDELTKPLKVNTVNGQRFKCTECNRYSAETEEQVQRHIRKMHRGQNPFQCYMCDYSTYNKPLFEEHVRIHKGIKPFKCSQCSYRSASKKNAKKHELVHRPDNPLKCPDCPFIGRHVRSFNHHRQQHQNGTVGEICPKKEEQEAVTESSEYVCEHCGTDFAVARNLASHQRNMKKCEECDEILCSKSGRHKCVKRAGRARFRCGVCPWRGSHRARVLLHLLHHPAQPGAPP